MGFSEGSRKANECFHKSALAGRLRLGIVTLQVLVTQSIDEVQGRFCKLLQAFEVAVELVSLPFVVAGWLCLSDSTIEDSVDLVLGVVVYASLLRHLHPRHRLVDCTPCCPTDEETNQQPRSMIQFIGAL